MVVHRVRVPGTLDTTVLEKKQWSDHRNVVILQETEHLLDPFGGDHFGVVVEQQHVLTRGVHHTEVALRREVECLVVGHEAHALRIDP